jgi:hypothetical protein
MRLRPALLVEQRAGRPAAPGRCGARGASVTAGASCAHASKSHRLQQAVCKGAQLGLPGAAGPGRPAGPRPAGQRAGAGAAGGRGGAGGTRGGEQQLGAGDAAHRRAPRPKASQHGVCWLVKTWALLGLCMGSVHAPQSPPTLGSLCRETSSAAAQTRTARQTPAAVHSTRPLQASGVNCAGAMTYDSGPVRANGVQVCALQPHAGSASKPAQCRCMRTHVAETGTCLREKVPCTQQLPSSRLPHEVRAVCRSTTSGTATGIHSARGQSSSLQPSRCPTPPFAAVLHDTLSCTTSGGCQVA